MASVSISRNLGLTKKNAALSLAVLALAVEDRKERDSVTTSASP